MLATYSRKGIKKTAVLENAFDIVETERLNAISSMVFSMPASDPKLKHCKPFDYVRFDGGALYRMMDTGDIIGTDTDVVTFQCEHVLATLLDNVIADYAQIDNSLTADVIAYVLSRQEIKHWKLGKCEFERRFSYAWNHETLAAALLSIPKQFDTGYKWTFDTTSYPWTLNLLKLDETAKPEFYVREGKNLLSAERQLQYRQACTRIYAYGYGEGINQLTFAKINGGKNYLDADQAVIDEYGLIERVWVDRRFEIAENLLARCKVLIGQLSKPYVTYRISVADIEKKTREYLDTPEAGKVIQFGDFRSYIIEVTRNLQEVGETQITVANQPQDIAGTIAEQAERARINQNYAQGNTFLYPINAADNADPSHPLKMRVFVPQEARAINKAILTWDLEAFRAYETGASAGGGMTASSSAGGGQTTSSGGASTQTSSSGGGGTSTSSSGGGGSTTSASSPQKIYGSNEASIAVITSSKYEPSIASVPIPLSSSPPFQESRTGFGRPSGSAEASLMHDHVFYVTSHMHDFGHTHTVNIKSHTHQVTIPEHSHDFHVPDHSHSVNIPAHSHDVSTPNHQHTVSDHQHQITLPEHSHSLIYGIFEGPRANTVTVKVDGKIAPVTGTQVDITEYFSRDGGGNIQRGTFHTIEIYPNSLTRINATVAVQMFIQTMGGGSY